MRPLAVLALLALPPLAGCLAPPAGFADGPPPASIPLQPLLDVTQWDGCRSAVTLFDLFPAGLGPGKPPPQWDADSGVASEVQLRLVDCASVAWGPFERPVRMVWELHDRLRPPPRCGENRTGYLYAVNRVFVSDGEVGRFLAQTYGLPVLHAAIGVAESQRGLAYEQVWTWTPEGAQPSTVTVGDAGLDNGRLEETHRAVWDNGGGVTLFEWTSDYRQRTAGQVPSHGTLRPPMLWAAYGETYAGTGGANPESREWGTLTRYGDYLCEEARPFTS